MCKMQAAYVCIYQINHAFLTHRKASSNSPTTSCPIASDAFKWSCAAMGSPPPLPLSLAVVVATVLLLLLLLEDDDKEEGAEKPRATASETVQRPCRIGV